MSKDNPFFKAIKRLASDALDVASGAVADAIKQEADLPRQRQRHTITGPADFAAAVAEVAEDIGCPLLWNDDETLAVLTVSHAGRWQVIVADHDGTVEIVVPTGLRFQPNQLPRDIATHALLRNVRIAFGGYDLLATDEGHLALSCRATLPAMAATGDQIRATIENLVVEVADLHARLK